MTKFKIPNFDPTWIDRFDEDIIQSILTLIVKNPDIRASITPIMQLELFKKMNSRQRIEFLKHLKITLIGDELKIFDER